MSNVREKLWVLDHPHTAVNHLVADGPADLLTVLLSRFLNYLVNYRLTCVLNYLSDCGKLA